MRRREFLLIAGGLVACSTRSQPTGDDPPDVQPDAADVPVDSKAGVDACVQEVVTMHDTYAQALYLDGSYGPLTGVVEVAYVTAGAAITLDFWHGHGGQVHRFTVTPEHFAALKRGEKITITTTTVDGHEHTLFVDPLDEDYRVPNAPDVDVPTGVCS
jgi:hypothetical protein